MRSLKILALLVACSTLLSLLPGCVRSDAYKKDRDFYEETPSGYYADSDAGKLDENGKRLERLKGPKKKVLVFSFWNDTPILEDELGVFAGEELKRGLYLTKRVLFPDDKRISSATKDFVQGDRVQTAQLVREGRRFGVSSVVVGRISKIKFRQNREEVGILREAESASVVDIEMKMFDVASGREVASYKRSGAASNTARVVFAEDELSQKEARIDLAKEAIREAVAHLVPDALSAMDKMDWQGRIAKLMGTKVYLNAGRASGLLSGDILRVLSPGEEIVDPVSKVFLGRSEGLLKGTLEVSEFIGTDSAMATIHTGGNFQEGDVVRLY
ncbi:MAG: hypothetical protein H7333_04245 [Bdellovibrionales bacterium]|nr:hypothetical protein [Oligoflexia bacterium]